MKYIFLFLLKIYKTFISPLLPSACRFYPSCSEYSRQAFLKHSWYYALYLSIKRLLKCHPFHPGGYDPVP